MQETTDQAVPPGTEDPLPRLSLVSFSIGLTLLLSVFLLLNPIWDAEDMNLWNENIWWSYAPIPLVVGVLLAIERKLSGATLLIETMKMTFVKFALTFLIAQVVWELRGVPGTGLPDAGPVAVDADAQRYEVRPAPASTTIPAASTGRVTGRVTDRTGEPLAEALVWISAGLEEFVFAPPAQAVVLANEGAGFEPGFAIVHTYQALVLLNHDTQLHTAVIANPVGKRLLNYPVIPGGERTLMFDRELGLARLHCTGHGADEPDVELLILGTPFVTRTDPDGRYTFEGVPAANLELAVRDGNGTLQVSVSLSPGATASADLGLTYSR